MIEIDERRPAAAGNVADDDARGAALADIEPARTAGGGGEGYGGAGIEGCAARHGHRAGAL